VVSARYVIQLEMKKTNDGGIANICKLDLKSPPNAYQGNSSPSKFQNRPVSARVRPEMT